MTPEQRAHDLAGRTWRAAIERRRSAGAVDLLTAELLPLCREAEARQWQPIETAPKDGTVIRLLDYRGDVYAGFWIPGVPKKRRPEGYDKFPWGTLDTGVDDCLQGSPNDGSFTHWMPLPEPPK